MTGKNPNISIAKDSFVGNALAFIGFLLVVVLVVFGMAGIASGPDSAAEIIVVVFVDILILGLIALSISLIVRGVKRIRLIQLFREYAAYLASDPYHSIDQLAAAKGVTSEKAKKALLEMVNRGYFANAYIDFDRNRLVFVQEDTTQKPGRTSQQAAVAMEYINVTCRGCGATNNIVKGSDGECEFCGNTLSGS